MFKHYRKSNKRMTILETLQEENDSIFQDIKALEKSMPDYNQLKKLTLVKEKFYSLAKQYSSFDSEVSTDLNTSKQQAKKFMTSIESQKSFRDKLVRKKSRIKSHEVSINSREKVWQKSLGKIHNLWQKNLSDMESNLRLQKEALKRLGTQNLSKVKMIEKEIQEAIDGPKVPNLHLEGLKFVVAPSKPSSARSSVSLKPSDDEDVISNYSAFSYITEDIVSHRSNSSRPRPPNIKRPNPPLPPAVPHSINNSYISEVNDSLEFEKLMQDIEKERASNQNPNSISMEKTMGGWKSEYESENESISFNLNADEIKKALEILKKARLLNAGNNQFLLKLAEMIRDPENSSNVELMLQLINIERKKNRVSTRSSSKLKKSGKPPTPTNSHLKKKIPSDLVGTAREKFLFSDDKSFNRTILSIESPFSPRAAEFFEGNMPNAEANDVKLEDLLNVPSMIDGIGLISADTSMVQDEVPRPKVIPRTREERKISRRSEEDYEDLPVKLAR